MPILDFAILTGLTEEFEVLRKLFPKFTECDEDGNIWYRTRIKSKGSNDYEIVAAFQNQMGPLDAQNLTVKIMERWDPAYIILVGVAGSFEKNVKLGEVIISQQIFYYDPGKAIAKGIKYRPQGYPCSAVLIRQIEALQLDERAFNVWQDRAVRSARRKANQLKSIIPNKRKLKLAQQELQLHRPEKFTLAQSRLVV